MTFRHIFLALPVVLLAAGAAACGDSGSSTSTTGTGGGDASCESGLTPVTNSEFCQAGSDLNCAVVSHSTSNQLCSVALPTPTAELARATDTDEFSGSGPPDASCFAVASYPPAPPASQEVDLTGHVRIFSHGCQSNNLTIEVFNVLEDGQLGARVGDAVTTPSDCADVGEQSDEDNCDPRWECEYTYPGVPSETPLAVKTSGGNWQALIAYNIYVPTADIVEGAAGARPTYEYDPRALATDDYGVIAQAAIGRPIAAGHGAIAGEVHDCGDVRVLNAVADVNVFKQGLVYFTSDEENPLPEAGAISTSRLGLYAALDIAPGPAVVAAAGLVNGQVVALGEHKVYVYPDTVTSLTFRGLRPTQVPAQ